MVEQSTGIDYSKKLVWGEFVGTPFPLWTGPRCGRAPVVVGSPDPPTFPTEGLPASIRIPTTEHFLLTPSLAPDHPEPDT